MNSYNLKYYGEILRIHGIDVKKTVFSEDEQAKIEEVFSVYEKNLPRSTGHQRLLLRLYSGERFEKKLWAYARPLIEKGAPALLEDLKLDVYRNQAKIKIVEDMLLRNLASMESQSTFKGEEDEQDPTVHLWLLYFTSQHYYFLKDFDRAFNYINKAIEHTPTVVDLYILKAKIYKHSGDKKRASLLYEEARKLDLADRYLNAVSSRYRIRIDEVQEAEETMALFSKDTGDDKLNVHDMQCMWFETECGNSYLRQGLFRQALKNFNYIEKHFE